MGETAVFVGAGASKACGYLLTREIFPTILREIDNENLFSLINGEKANAEDRKQLRKQLRQLFPGLGRVTADENLPMITDVLSLVDQSIATATPTFPGKTIQDLQTFRTLLSQAIFDVLVWQYEKSRKVDAVSRAFALWLERISQSEPLGIISTNYDIGVDSALFRRHNRLGEEEIEKRFDFGFDWRDPGGTVRTRPTHPEIALYKLHGSFNWLRCPLCEQVYVNVYGAIAHHAFRKVIDDNNTCHCGHARVEAQIVAPSIVRDTRDANLLEMWRHALELMRRADEWVIIGYSFPMEDVAIRSLFLRAYQGRARNQQKKLRIRVVQMGAADEPRYRILFPRCEYFTGGLREFLKAEGIRV